MKPKAFSQEWKDSYLEKCYDLANHLIASEGWRLAPPIEGELDTWVGICDTAHDLWLKAVGRIGRAPQPLLVDCLYICAKLSGNRVGIKAIKRATKDLWGKSIEVLPLDRRRDNRRWVWAYRYEILQHYPDEAAWEDFVSAWRDKIVDPAYFDEGEKEC